MRLPQPLAVLMLLGLSLLPAALLAQDAPVEKLVRENCSGCHGPDGNSSQSAVPKLAGLQPRYLMKQLKDFASGLRKGESSLACASGLSGADIENLAVYFGGQKPSSGQAADAALLAVGQNIYEHGIPERDVDDCLECHRAKGAGSGLYPRVGGQHADYSARQMRAFARKARSNDKDEIMHDVAEKMTDEEMRAVAEYMMAM